ncbi:MAG: fused FliR family export protein/FlhB family type III secretion system protein [Clostridium sp.]|nr:fused FliR family export protein/FlhB family type III secretion system protein [Clostridium sp.]
MVDIVVFIAFLMVFMRITAMIGTVSVFFPTETPNLAKVGMGLLIAMIVTPVIDVNSIPTITNTGTLIVLMGKEIILGLCLGYIVNLIFSVIRMAGQFMDFSMGFSMAMIYDPQMGETSSLMGRTMYWICVAVFLLVDGHHILIQCLLDSFTAVPIGNFVLNTEVLNYIIQVIFEFFSIGFRIAIPIIIIILISEIVLGLVSRVMPQLNAMILAIPIKIAIGLVTLSILLPVIIKTIGNNFGTIKDIFNEIFKLVPIVLISASNDSGDKSEKPTPKKLEDAKKKGQVARSKELSSALTLVGTTLVIAMLSGFIISTLKEVMELFLGGYLNYAINEQSVIKVLVKSMIYIFMIFLPVALPVMAFGVIGSIAQVGFIHSGEPLKPQLSKLNPISGFKRMFSVRSLVDLVKNLAIVSVIGYIGYSYLKDNYYSIINMGNYKFSAMLLEIVNLSKGIFLKVTIALGIIGVVDFVYQKFQHTKDLKMTKQEIKEEYKQQEGDPQIKGKRRQKQRELAMRRMMQSVPDATVVITNPTHIAVALKYEENSGAAPKVIAKGSENVALRIKELAIENKVPIIENKPLARLMFKEVELDKEIPIDMYKAVAEILVLVLKMKK